MLLNRARRGCALSILRGASLTRCLTMLLVVINGLSAAAQPADTIITNGRLFGTDASSTATATSATATSATVTAADAIAIAGERIIAVGKSSELEKLKGPGTQVVDANGATVMPGLHDAHVHFLSGSLSLSQIDLSNSDDLGEIEATIRTFVDAHPDQPVYVGRGWLYGSFAGGLPDKALLDRLIPDRPAIMRCYDGHTVWVNSKALEAAGIQRDTPDPAAGIIVRDPATGQATGVLKESAQNLIDSVIPQPSRDEKLAALRQGIAHAHRLGVTSVCEAGIGLAELESLETLRAAGELSLRYRIALEGKPSMTEADMDQLDALKQRFPELDIHAVKLYVDGVIESHTAALLAPYANRTTLGLPETTASELNRVVSSLDRRGWQIMVHAIGDGGIRMTLNALEQAAKQNSAPEGGRRHRLEHIESISQSDIARFGALGIIASMQPYHANPNGNIFNVWAVNLGPERASRAWAWNSIRKAGGRLAFGSDWPVVSIDPRLGIHVALTRQTLDGQPPEGFLPEQRLPLDQVLEAYTAGAAYAQFAESQQGSLKPGQLADVVIWDRDLFALAPDQVHQAQVKQTWFGGKLVTPSR